MTTSPTSGRARSSDTSRLTVPASSGRARCSSTAEPVGRLVAKGSPVMGQACPGPGAAAMRPPRVARCGRPHRSEADDRPQSRPWHRRECRRFVVPTTTRRGNSRFHQQTAGRRRARTSSGMGRTAIVTGAASGIGRAIAEWLVHDGADVLAVDLSPNGDVPGIFHEADLTTREGNRSSVEAALERFGRLDTVIANAGFQHVAPVAEFPEDRWDALVSLLLTSPFLLAKYAWGALGESGDGRFVAVASVHGLVASPYKAAYVSAKHGVVGLVRTLALEGAPDGVLATAVCPGFVRTPLVEGQIADQAKAHGVSEERVL